MENGRVARVWTADLESVAEPQELESFASRMSQYKLKRKRVGGLKLEELPAMEALQTPGTSNGQTKVIREGDNGVAYSWNSKDYKWDKEKKSYALPELEVSRLGDIFKILKHYHSTNFADAEVVLLLNLLRSWPRESLFPGN